MCHNGNLRSLARCWGQAKISTSEIQIKDLTDRVEAPERLNEQLTLRARDLELAASAATSAPAVRWNARTACFAQHL